MRALALILLSSLAFGQMSEPRALFRVKHVAEGAIYLDGGRSSGLSEGMKLTITRDTVVETTAEARAIAEVEIVAVAESSSVCSILASREPIRAGDAARLSPQDAETIQALKAVAGRSKYAQVVTFSEGDPIEEEARESVPRPPSPEVNRARGRIGFEYGATHQPGSGPSSSQTGLVFRGDMSRIGGTYWSLSGYWRGRMNSRRSAPEDETLTDLLNRTYHLTLTYNNPRSRWTAGFGRFYLPWATSLSTIDGGYVGRRYGKKTTFGAFAGSTPDPTSWNYNPNRQLLGVFGNYESGSFDALHLTTTAGVAVTRIHWQPERQFAFFENGIFYKRYLSIYHNLEADQFRNDPSPGASVRRERVVVGRSFLTFRVQPSRVLSLDLSHNYFRGLPTFDPRLVGTGLVDRFLFQGLSAGFRLDLPHRVSTFANFGRSSRSGDTRRSLNQMYGLGMSNIWKAGIRAEARYSRFDSSFGRGTYRSVSLMRELNEAFRLEIQAGEQDIVSAITRQTRSRFVNASADWLIGNHYFLGSGFTRYRGQVQQYDQVYLNLGYRF